MAHLHPEDEENTNFPDLPNEITGEQLVLEQKVFRKNEEFIRLHSSIRKWLSTPEINREYPVKYK